MCVNYAPARRQLLRDIFGVEPPAGEWKAEAWPDYAAPIVRASHDHGALEAVVASFSMVPRSRLAPGVRYFPTANARVETIGQKTSFAKYWRAGQRCLIPAEAYFEPNWETGKAVRWQVRLASSEPFAIAGLWRAWPDGAISFTMPTLNADSHPVLKRFHRPGEEKRAVVILPRESWGDWLEAADAEFARALLHLLPPDQLAADPAPALPRVKPSSPAATNLTLL